MSSIHSARHFLGRAARRRIASIQPDLEGLTAWGVKLQKRECLTLLGRALLNRVWKRMYIYQINQAGQGFPGKDKKAV